MTDLQDPAPDTLPTYRTEKLPDDITAKSLSAMAAQLRPMRGRANEKASCRRYAYREHRVHCTLAGSMLR